MKVEKTQKKQIASEEATSLSCQSRINRHESVNIKQGKVKEPGFLRLSLRRDRAKHANRLQNQAYDFANVVSVPWFKKLLANTRTATQKLNTTLNKVTEKRAKTTSGHLEKLDLIRSRLSENFYNSPEVHIKIAQGLLREMNLSKTDQC